MNNPLITKREEADVSKMNNNNSGKANMGHLYAQMQHKKMQEANDAVQMMMDHPDLYDYDGEYDKIQEARKAATTAQKTEKKESRLISCIMAAKGVRERETLIRKDRLAEKEIKRTGNEGLKEERYITSSYMKELEENKKFLEDDKKKEERNEKNSAFNRGSLETFHKNILTNNGLSGRQDLSKQIEINKEKQKQEQEKKNKEIIQQQQQQQSTQSQKDQDGRQNMQSSYASSSQRDDRSKRDHRDRDNDDTKRKKSRSRDRERKRSRSRDDNKHKSHKESRRHDNKGKESRKDSRSQERKSRSKERKDQDKKIEIVEVPQISKEDKIRLAKERYLQRQQEQQNLLKQQQTQQ